MSSQKQISIRATYMRGGTSKGVFFNQKDLPAAAQVAGVARDKIMLRVIGSPDPYGKQIDGMGNGSSSTSKVVIIGPSDREDCDVDYLFGAVAIDAPVVDWSGNCGNLSSAVGPYAIQEGLVDAGPDGLRTVRIWQANLGKRIIAHVPVKDGQVVELGDFELDGVTFPAAEVQLEFLDPGADEDSDGGAMFPTGNFIDTLDIPGFGVLEATLINAGNPTIFVNAKTLGLSGVELQDDVNANTELLKTLESIRAHATVAMGLASTAQEATEKRPHTPKLAFISGAQAYTASSGKALAKEAIDITARIMSMGKLHHAMTGTGAIAIAVAGAIPGTVVSAALGGKSQAKVKFGHPSGILAVGAEANQDSGDWVITKALMSRTARRLMTGEVWVPEL
ncbi:2-methylaconitate cis-trans isomerase PrpF [Polynucleobacter sinensis]|uniref:2-methylaconitate cis-trans isomerase PrpF n=1 Tax=Polynucleobacter sinensis TaxID=1743157 RepID=UPI00078103A9|nr:2-methylaconitate cis-trans isomerase PrpF [Polynucleobacter sinensis]